MEAVQEMLKTRTISGVTERLPTSVSDVKRGKEKSQGRRITSREGDAGESGRHASANGGAYEAGGDRGASVRLVPLTEKDDIEVMFERIMQAHKVEPIRWTQYLAPNLTGKAQQAFAQQSTREHYSLAMILMKRRTL